MSKCETCKWYKNHECFGDDYICEDYDGVGIEIPMEYSDIVHDEYCEHNCSYDYLGDYNYWDYVDE